MTVEFLTLGVILLVPIVYLVLALAALQGAQLAVEGAARHAARVYVQFDPSVTPAGAADGDVRAREAEEAATRAVRYAFADFGIDPAAAEVRIDCAGRSRCLAPGEPVAVTVSTVATLPLFARAGGVTVQAQAVQTVSRFRP